MAESSELWGGWLRARSCGAGQGGCRDPPLHGPRLEQNQRVTVRLPRAARSAPRALSGRGRGRGRGREGDLEGELGLVLGEEAVGMGAAAHG